MTTGTARMRDWRELESGESIGRQAAQRALRRLNAREAVDGDVRLSCSCPSWRADWSVHFLGAIRGGSQYRRASFLLDSAGEQVFPAWMHISERPHILKGLGSTPFDGEGVATTRS